MTIAELLATGAVAAMGLIVYFALGVVAFFVVDLTTNEGVREIIRTSPDYIARSPDHTDPGGGILPVCFLFWPIGAFVAWIGIKLSQKAFPDS